ncbi:MAG: ATP-dependent helicase UvrD/PcrA [Streptosporangiaceae bacterium]|nr:ATP-dependent helicase UvrD/PcrA [Streptosporangiaceae bacterium]
MTGSGVTGGPATSGTGTSGARTSGAMTYTPVQLARLLGLPEPTAEQAAVIGAPPRPLAVIAGAGSGKSETMAARLVWLVANGVVRPERVLGLTFTRKAAAELGQRVRARLDGLRKAGLPGLGQAGPGPQPPETAADLDGEPVVSTYHAYAARLVADHALREALEPTLRLITPAVAWQIAARVVSGYGGPMDAVTWSPPAVTAAVLTLAGELAEHLRTPGEVTAVGDWLEMQAAALPGRVPSAVRKILECQRAREQLLPMVAGYARAKAEREVIDHGDQVAVAARIAAHHPEVGTAERGRYQVVLLDEYQDTSHAQLVLLRALFGGGHPVTAVGDPCQSIYGWRGASAGNLRRFGRDFPVVTGSGPGRTATPAVVRVLSTSFRNTGRVLDVAAVVQEGLRAAAPEVPRLVPPPGRAGRGRVTCALTETAAGEAAWVAEQVSALLELPPGVAPDGGPWPDGREDAVHPRDIAVLCRKRAQFPALRAALEARGIPVEVVGLGGLLTVPEVADIVATLRVLHDPGASAPLARLLTGPRWRIGPRDLVALGKRARALAREQRRSAETRGRPAERIEPDRGGPGRDEDPLAKAITDLTADPGSLIEALDDLGESAAYSAAGHARLAALAAELRELRSRVARPLPDLVGEVERALGLDIEVAARPGRDMASARADLDAFADAAAAFAGDQEEPTLGAFLAYLTAAEEEEFGLEAGRVGDGDTVTLATVHASKGLQWAAVVVPGLSAGKKAQVFPAKPRFVSRWTENARLLPFGLRGDAGDLPALPSLEPAALAAFGAACATRDLGEERRLAYVATTRAAFWLACSGYWWADASSPLGPSVFLEEVKAACEAGAGTVACWTPPPEEDSENPALAEPSSAVWPAEPDGTRHDAVREAADLVNQAMAGPRDAGGAGDEPLSEEDQALVAAWDTDTGLLLAERGEWRAEAASAVWLPPRLSVSALVMMARNPAELARQIRRPMPRPPAPQARRGTAFHRWLEERFSQQRLIDPDDLLGAADDPAAGDPADGDANDLAALRELFESGEWGNRWPVEVEVPFETLIAGRPVRGRIDAVFGDAPEGGFDVVDWKTGQPPGGAAEHQAIAVQLAAYRLAWAQLAGVPADQVRAAFYYVRHDLTLRPADLLDEAGLAALIEQIPAGAG